MKIKRFLLMIMADICFMFMAEGCSEQPKEISDIVIWENITQPQLEEKQNADTEHIAEIYCKVYEEMAQTESLSNLEKIKSVVNRLGENGYAAVDSENQVNMTNADRVLAFCDAVDAKENAELTIVEIVNREDLAMQSVTTCEFRKYDFRTENGRVDIVRGYYCFDVKGNLVKEDHISYLADLWRYTEEGYFVFKGSYFADDYYIIALTDEPEYAAFRVKPLDTECRDLYQKYIQSVGYKDNNLFLINWTEEDFGNLNFYDMFDRFYPLVHYRPVPYKNSENPGIGAVYRIAENEFEDVVGTYLNIDSSVLRSKTTYFPEERRYEYKPRGFYELGCSNMPYPEVVDYTENKDHTITLTVNAVFPYECTSKAFSHEVVIRPLEDGGFQYVSNKIIEGYYDAWWYTGRLTDDEWEEVYANQGTLGTEERAEQNVAEAGTSLWYIPQAENCLLTESEKDEINNKVLGAANQVSEVYQDMDIEEGASYASNVNNFSTEQCKEVVTLLGNAGYISVTEDVNMENYQDFESFYNEYRSGREAAVTVFNVNRDGMIGAVTLVYRKTHKKDAIQTYYVGVGWKEGGVPTIKNTWVSDVAAMELTEKGYFIYTYKESIIHSDANQYWRVKPLSETCRELTRKYIAGLSFTNYNAFVVDWDDSNVEDILMPCMFEDIYRIATGENMKIETEWIPSETYERTMMTYFPVSREQLRSKCGYNAENDSYPYEMIFAAPHSPFGEVTDYTENADGTITLFVDGVWIDYNSDYAFTNKIVVQPFADGTFRYLSNRIQPKELELPTAASAAR